jgi:hypothetical protein
MFFSKKKKKDRSNYVALSYLKIAPVAGTAQPVSSQPTCGKPTPVFFYFFWFFFY